MEAIGLASGVAGLITLALQVSGTINQYTTAIKDRDKNVRELHGELSLLVEVLRQLKDFLQTEHAQGHVFDEGCVLSKAVRDCTQRVERIGNKLLPPSGGRLARTWDKLTWPFEQKDVLQMVENLRRFHSTFQFALNIRGYAILSKTSDDASKMLKEMLGEVQKVGEMSKLLPGLELAAAESIKTSNQIQEIIILLPTLLQQASDIKDIGHAVRTAEERERQRQKAEILDWLAPASSLHKHLEIQKRRASDTGQWFLQHDYFSYWTDNADADHDLLCVGGPGRGKTVLCSLVIDHLRIKFRNSDTAVVHYYCDFSEQQAQTPAHLTCCILRQLCQSSNTIPVAVSEFYSKTRNELRDSLWFQELQTVTQRVIGTFRQCIILIDALDETDMRDQRPGLFRTLAALRASGTTRLFATTRSHVDIEREFRNVVKIEVSADMSDLQHFLDKKIQEHPHSADLLDAELKSEIIQRLCQNADGMFLLPALQIDRVLDQATKGDIKRALNSLFTDLEDAFRSTIDRVRNFAPYKRDLAYKVFMWTAHARRPLHISELQQALAVRFDEDDINDDDVPRVHLILDSCCGLIELDGESGYVRFVHFSLYEHLRKEDHGMFAESQVIITRVCLKYLTFESLKPLPFKNRSAFVEAQADFPFLDYASSFWGYHAKALDINAYQDLALPLLNDSHSLLVTAKVRDAKNPDSRKWMERMYAWAFNGGGGISLAASFGLTELTRLLISQSQTPVLSSRNMYGSTPLHECAMFGYAETAELLIAHNADLLDSNRGKATPFYLAVSYGQLDMCRMLLKHDLRQLDTACRDDYTALHKASDLGSDDIVTFLLQSGALVNAKEIEGMTPLHLACRRGYISVVSLLAKARADLSARTHDGVTPLDMAATGGFLTICEHLLQNGANVLNKSKVRWTALHRAARAGHAHIVKLLLDSGAEILSEDKGGRTPLILAVKGGNMATVKLLLEYDPDLMLTQLQHKEKGGSSTKTVAFYTAHYDIHKYLRDLENNLQGHDSISLAKTEPTLPLTHAIEKGLLPMVQALLKAQPELLTMRDSSGSTALHTAFIEGQREIAEEILSHDVSINIRGYHEWTPLHIAASHGSTPMLSLALSYNADVHAVTETLQTPLHKAASAHNLTNLVELLRCGCDSSTRNNKGMTALHVAAYQNFDEGVRELLKPEWSGEKALALAKDSRGRTARVWAEFSGHLEIAAYLRVEERRAKDRLSGRGSSSPSLSLSRMSTATSFEGGRGTSRSGTFDSNTLSRQSTVGLLSPPLGSRHSHRQSADSIVSADDLNDRTERGNSPIPVPSPVRTPTTPIASTPKPGTPVLGSASASGYLPTSGESEGLREIERRYAAMALDFESD